jgi:hypothetical protein
LIRHVCLVSCQLVFDQLAVQRRFDEPEDVKQPVSRIDHSGGDALDRIQHVVELAGRGLYLDSTGQQFGRDARRAANSRYANGSISSFLANSQSEASNIALIEQSAVQSAGQLYAQIASTEGQQAAADRQAKEQAQLNPPDQQNFTPPATLNPVEYYSDGSSLDTTSNVLTMSNGNQIDITTGLSYVDPNSLIQIANGAYIDTTTTS